MSNFEHFEFDPNNNNLAEFADPISEFPIELQRLDEALNYQAEMYGGVDVVLDKRGKYVLSLADSLSRVTNTATHSKNRISETIAAASVYTSNRHILGNASVEIPSAENYGGMSLVTTELMPPHIAGLLSSPSGASDLFFQSFISLEELAPTSQLEKIYSYWKESSFKATSIIEQARKND